jgi:hypothetical protein
VIADERLAQMPAVGFLARAHELHPGAKRVLLSNRGDWSPSHTAVGAVAQGQIDYHLLGPWAAGRRPGTGRGFLSSISPCSTGRLSRSRPPWHHKG